MSLATGAISSPLGGVTHPPSSGARWGTIGAGPRCRDCGTREDRCAWLLGNCCSDCTHWLSYDPQGNERLSVSLGRRRLPVEHSTERGYQQHRVRGERPCNPCKAAHSRRVTAGRRVA